jgi:hypothetical protein
LVLAADEDRAHGLVGQLDLAEGSAVIVWIPSGLSAAQMNALAQRLQTVTKAGVAIVAERLAWTIVGRLIGAVQSYCDDGSPAFARYRRLADSYGVSVVRGAMELPIRT